MHCGGSGNGLLPDGTKPLPEPMIIILENDFYKFNFIQAPMS